jgi:hypothetical protein
MPFQLRYYWDAGIRRFRDSRGRLVAARAVRSALFVARQRAAVDARQLLESYYDRRLAFADWLSEMQALLRDVHLYHAAVANGGFPSMTQAQYAATAQELNRQFAYLQRLGSLIRVNAISRAQALARIELFARSGLITFTLATEQQQREIGRTRERNRLGIGEHCSDCLSQSARGFVQIGALIPVGRRRCRGNCQCYIEYAN